MTNRDLYWRVMDSLAWGMSTKFDYSLRASETVERVLVSRVQNPSGELSDALLDVLLFYQEYIQHRTMATLQTQRRTQESIAASRTKVRTTNKDVDDKVRVYLHPVHLRLQVDRDVTLLLINQVSDVVRRCGGQSIYLATK